VLAAEKRWLVVRGCAHGRGDDRPAAVSSAELDELDLDPVGLGGYGQLTAQ
jgi:hypothetical protein